VSFRTLLIDDEPLALSRLRRLLKVHAASVTIIGEAENGQEAVEKIEALQPDLIFLDIQMPELSGFEVLERIGHMPLIIFTTAYDEFALRAFDTNSVDYLLKPIDPERLQKAIDKLQRMGHENQAAFEQQMSRLVASLGNKPKKRIQVEIGDRIRLLDVGDIFFFKSDEKYVAVNTFDQVFLTSTTLKQLEAELPSDDFVRVHRSAIVNLKHLSEIVRGLGGSYRLRMRDKQRTELPVSRRSKTNLGLG
jgi:two-component system LytT family response regulator